MVIEILSIHGIMFWTSILHSLSVTNFQLDLKYYRNISLVFKYFICKPKRVVYFILRLQLFYGIRICIRHPAEKNTIIYPKGVSLAVPFSFFYIFTKLGEVESNVNDQFTVIALVHWKNKWTLLKWLSTIFRSII